MDGRSEPEAFNEAAAFNGKGGCDEGICDEGICDETIFEETIFDERVFDERVFNEDACDEDVCDQDACPEDPCPEEGHVRVVGGRWGGRDLVSPSGRVRPTAEPVRAAIAEMVADELKGARTLDLFAGTGAVGIEFLSRGARSCDFVEDDPSALHALKANVVGLRLPPRRARIFRKDAIPFVERLGLEPGGVEPGGVEPGGGEPRGGERPGRAGGVPYDLAYADPPWGSRKLDRVLGAWRARPFSRLLLLEHAADHPPEALQAGGEGTDGVDLVQRRVGDAMLTLFRRRVAHDPQP